MTANAVRLFDRATTLDADERMALAGQLIESVSPEPEIFAIRLNLAHARLEDIQTGRVKAISREENFTKVTALRHACHPSTL